MPGQKQEQERETTRAVKRCSTLDSFVVPALKRMNPGPVAGASDVVSRIASTVRDRVWLRPTSDDRVKLDPNSMQVSHPNVVIVGVT